MTSKTIRIGTRGSRLALWQAYKAAEELQKAGLATEIVIIETKGDKILDTTIAKIGSKGVFTEELEVQLREKTIDIAVHSAKDMQSELPDDLHLLAFMEREAVHDVLVSYLPAVDLQNSQLVLGTSSTRRVAMLRRFYPHVKVVDMRGNLQTRMKKLQDGACDALVLAYAGVHRMEYGQYIVANLPTEQFTPPVGQGSIAVEAAKDLDKDLAHQIRQVLNHTETEYRLLAERAFLRELQGGCSIPTFALAQLTDNQLFIHAGLIGLDGKEFFEAKATGTPQQAELLGKQVATEVLQQGGAATLHEIKQALKKL